MQAVAVEHDVGDARRADLMALFAGEWWTGGRSEREVDEMLAGSTFVLGLVDRATDRLVGFARVLSDGVFTENVGRSRLMRRTSDPRLADGTTGA